MAWALLLVRTKIGDPEPVNEKRDRCELEWWENSLIVNVYKNGDGCDDSMGGI